MTTVKAICNINVSVRVKLTPMAHKFHRQNYDSLWSPSEKRLYEYRAPKEDAEGWSTWLLWELMKEFGPHIHMGMQPLFDLGELQFLDFTVDTPAAVIADTTKMCQVPPEGWLCTRESGHDGPCAAHPTKPVTSFGKIVGTYGKVNEWPMTSTVQYSDIVSDGGMDPR